MTAKNPRTRRHNSRLYKSGLEDTVAKQLEAMGITNVYEVLKVSYVIPESKHKYTPDFLLPNGIIVETKGIFSAEDRKKHLLIKQQYPESDIRFVFSSSRTKLYKGSKTTYGDWCTKNGFRYADKLIPESWIRTKHRESTDL